VNVFIDLTRNCRKATRHRPKTLLKISSAFTSYGSHQMDYPKRVFLRLLGFPAGRLRSTTKPRLSRDGESVLLAYDDTGNRIVKGCHAFPATLCTLAPTATRRVWNGIQIFGRRCGISADTVRNKVLSLVSSNVIVGRGLALSASVGKRIRLQLIEWHSLQAFPSPVCSFGRHQ
jgi:hypothetical protein